MGYNKDWETTTERDGVETRITSPKGWATVRNEETGWVVRGETTLTRYDARPMVSAPGDIRKVVWLQQHREDVPAGPFERTYDDFKTARQWAHDRLTIIPARVPFEIMDAADTAEGRRDHEYFVKIYPQWLAEQKSEIRDVLSVLATKAGDKPGQYFGLPMNRAKIVYDQIVIGNPLPWASTSTKAGKAASLTNGIAAKDRTPENSPGLSPGAYPNKPAADKAMAERGKLRLTGNGK
jgi:hypothetical protein